MGKITFKEEIEITCNDQAIYMDCLETTPISVRRSTKEETRYFADNDYLLKEYNRLITKYQGYEDIVSDLDIKTIPSENDDCIKTVIKFTLGGNNRFESEFGFDDIDALDDDVYHDTDGICNYTVTISYDTNSTSLCH